MSLGSTQRPTEMSVRNNPGVKGRPALRAEISPPFVIPLCRKCRILDVSQPYEHLRPVRGINTTL
jgi:hypothetical protein